MSKSDPEPGQRSEDWRQHLREKLSVAIAERCHQSDGLAECMKMSCEPNLERILDEIDRKLKCEQIDFENDAWRKDIPSEAGWYLIKTNAPLHLLKAIRRSHKAHADFHLIINCTSALQGHGMAIVQAGNEDYVVYNGQAANLKARAREHECGHPKTYCLAVSDHRSLRSYRWSFCYVPASGLCGVVDSDPLFRVAVEQGWRSRHGWPVLCQR